jgi:hypothetical protein
MDESNKPRFVHFKGKDFSGFYKVETKFVGAEPTALDIVNNNSEEDRRIVDLECDSCNNNDPKYWLVKEYYVGGSEGGIYGFNITKKWTFTCLRCKKDNVNEQKRIE